MAIMTRNDDMSETMKIGKDYVDFYKDGYTFYELSLANIRADNLEMQMEHMKQKRWFTQQMAVNFRQALNNWVNFGNALKGDNK
jgi:hypothetical protein